MTDNSDGQLEKEREGSTFKNSCFIQCRHMCNFWANTIPLTLRVHYCNPHMNIPNTVQPKYMLQKHSKRTFRCMLDLQLKMHKCRRVHVILIRSFLQNWTQSDVRVGWFASTYVSGIFAFRVLSFNPHLKKNRNMQVATGLMAAIRPLKFHPFLTPFVVVVWLVFTGL